jgi:hypothetical protein
MKKIPFSFILLFLFAGQVFSQNLKEFKVNVNTVSYPTLPLIGDTYRISANGLGAIEQYGVSFDKIESHFQKTEKMKYSTELNTYYLVNLFFNAVGIANVSLKKEPGMNNTTEYTMVGECRVPIEMEIIDKDGFCIVPRYFCFQTVPVSTDKCGTEADARKKWEDKMKNRNALITECILTGIKTTALNFQYRHDIFTEQKRYEFKNLKPTKKFTDDSWDKAAQQIESLALRVMPGQSMADYRDEVMPLIAFYDQKFDEYKKDMKKKKDYLYPSVVNVTNLKVLAYDFEGIEKYGKVPEVSWLYRSAIEHQMKISRAVIEKHEKTFALYKSGYTIDAEYIEKGKKEAVKDSLLRKASLVKIYYKNNSILEGKAFINEYRPYVERPAGGIYDLDFGKYLNYCGMEASDKVISRILADEVTKVVAGDDVLYTVKTEDDKPSKFAYCVYENNKIRMLNLRSTYIFQKVDTGETYSHSFLALNGRKKLAEFFADDAKLAGKILDKDLKLNNAGDLLAIAKLYSGENE